MMAGRGQGVVVGAIDLIMLASKIRMRVRYVQFIKGNGANE